jgi:hypothetical protein
MVSREQMEECHRLSQTLRTENAQLKDQVLALRSQNQDLSERSVDDVRRIAQLEDVNQRLETSVEAYQDERGRLESAYKELRASLPGSLKPLSLSRAGEVAAETNSAAPKPHDPQPIVSRNEEQEDRDEERDSRSRVGGRPAKVKAGAWAPSRPAGGDRPIPEPGNP